MEKKRILLLGNGGHCRSVMDTILSLGSYDEIGIVEKSGTFETDEGMLLIGTDDDLPFLFNDGWTNAVITVGSVGNTRVREKLYSNLKEIGFYLPTIVDPSAIVSVRANVEEGTFIGKRAIVNTGTSIGKCAIINSGAIIEHDCTIGQFTHVSPGATICGEVYVGNYSHIGAGSSVRQQIRIGERSLIGVGSVVVGNIPDNVVAYGNPCRIHSK